MSVALAVRETAMIEVRETCRQLAACEVIDEAREIRAQASAVQNYLGKRTVEAMNAAEIKVRAERRLGELLGPDTDRRGAGLKSHGGTSNPLPEGIRKQQASAWRMMARVPEMAFEAYIIDRRAAGLEISTAGVLHLLPVETETADERADDQESAEACNTESGSCGAPTNRDKQFHIAGLVESLTKSMNLFEAVKGYELDPLIEHGTKKSLRELSKKADSVIEWLQSLKSTIRRRTK